MTILRRRPVRIPWLLGLLNLCCALHAPALERWFYVSENFSVDQNVADILALMQRAAQAGYTHMLVNDSKFCRLGAMEEHGLCELEFLDRCHCQRRNAYV